MAITESEILSKLKTLIPQKRFDHTLRVREAAKALAQRWNVDENKASIAALLHDSAKSADEAAFNEKGIILDSNLKDIHSNYFPIFHAFAGPLWVKSQFGIDDEEILSAIKWHTTGKKEMSPLDQVIFIADFIEPQREFKIRTYAEELAKKDLASATACISHACIYHLLLKTAKVHPFTLECYNTYRNSLNADEKKKIAEYYK